MGCGTRPEGAAHPCGPGAAEEGAGEEAVNDTLSAGELAAIERAAAHLQQVIFSVRQRHIEQLRLDTRNHKVVSHTGPRERAQLAVPSTLPPPEPDPPPKPSKAPRPPRPDSVKCRGCPEILPVKVKGPLPEWCTKCRTRRANKNAWQKERGRG